MTYPQFQNLGDCEERLRKLETTKDESFAKLQDRTQRAIARLTIEAAVRKDVHRDDWNRAAILIAGLKRISALGGEAATLAEATLDEALGGPASFKVRNGSR